MSAITKGKWAHDEDSDWFVVSEYIVDLVVWEWLEDEKKQVILLGAPITCSNASRNFFCPFYLPINNAATRQFSNRTGKRTSDKPKKPPSKNFPQMMQQSLEHTREKNWDTFFAVIISLSENLKKAANAAAATLPFFRIFESLMPKWESFCVLTLKHGLCTGCRIWEGEKLKVTSKERKKSCCPPSCSMHLGKRSRKMERHGNTRLRTPLKGTLFEKLSPKMSHFFIKGKRV